MKSSSDSASAILFFRSLLDTAERLASHNITIYHVEYHLLAFGSWQMAAGYRHERLKFIFDGKDSLLSVQVGKFSDSSGGSWSQEKQWFSLLDKKSTTDVFQFVEEHLLGYFV